MKTFLSALLVSLVCYFPLTAQQSPVATTTSKAVALLYAQTDDGSLDMRCTTTAFDTVKGGYKFVSAAHCVGEDDVQGHQAASADNQSFWVTFDEKNPKTFYEAVSKGVGYQHRGDDFSVWEVKTDQHWSTIQLGDEKDALPGDSVINVASPLGLGKQLFRGTITSTYLDRPVVDGDINWKGTILLNISAGPGSSGSAIVDEKSGKIIGFLVGVINAGGTPNVIAIPVSRFKSFLAAKSAGTYKF